MRSDLCFRRRKFVLPNIYNKRPAPADDDARRRYYRLTSLGKLLLDAECERLQELVLAIKSKRAMLTDQG